MITLYTHFVGNINLPNTSPNNSFGEALAVAIAKYEPIFLKEILGITLYDLFQTNIAQGSGVYHDLLVGADYTNSSDIACRYEGLNGVGTNPIANFIYCKVQEERFTNAIGIGERQANSENMVLASPSLKIIQAWNEMVDWLWVLDDFLRETEDYPTYIGINYPPYDKTNYYGSYIPHMVSNNKYFQKINQFGL